MNILASVVPGVRDVRAPLVAGYLWLLIAWLLIEPDVPLDDEGGILGSVVALADLIGPIPTAVAVSVAAYLLGAVSRVLSSFASTALRRDRIRRLVCWIFPSLRGSWPELGERHLAVLEPLEGKEAAFKRLKDFASEKAPDTIRAYNSGRRAYYDAIGSIGTKHERQALSLVMAETYPLVRYLSARDLVALYEAADESMVRVGNELDLPSTLLLGNEPQTFAEVDRLRAEGELRLAVVPPLSVLSVLLALQESWLWIAALTGIVVLLWQGAHREDDARSLVANAIAHRNQVPSPARHQFAEAVRQLREKYADKRESDDVDQALEQARIQTYIQTADIPEMR